MDHVMKGESNIITYIDDILAHSPNHHHHVQTLRRCFDRLREFGLKLRLEKCDFGSTEVTYLGYRLTPSGVVPGKDKLEAVRKFPEPDTIRKIREFCGLTNYFRIMIKDFSKKTRPLTKLIRNDSGYKKGKLPDEAAKAFLELKNDLIKEPVVSYPNQDKPFILTTDAACGDDSYEGGLGAILSQNDDNNNEVVIAYASRGLKTFEKNYTPYLLELTAITWALDHFHNYLYGNKQFTIRTDHKPIETLSKIHKKTLNRLQQQMLDYNFIIEYKPGSENTAADALSRNAINAIEDFTETSIIKLQLADKLIFGILKFMDHEVEKVDPSNKNVIAMMAPHCFLDDNGILYYTIKRKNMATKAVILAPKILHQEIIKAAHLTSFGGHGGVFRTIKRITNDYFWPSVAKDVLHFVTACDTCQRAKGAMPRKTPLKSLPVPDKPGDRVHIDLFGPVRTSESGKKFIMIMTDAFSKYAEIEPIPNKSAEEVAKCFFERWVATHSAPTQVVSDQGKEFTNEIFKKLMKLLNINKSQTTPFHPMSNSSAESFNRSLIKYLKTMLNNDSLNWEQLLPALKLSYNTNIHKSTLHSPFFLTFLHDPKLPYFDIDKPKIFYNDDYATAAYKTLEKAYSLVKLNAETAAIKQAKYYDSSNTTKIRSFKIGDLVLLHTTSIKVGINKKFIHPWTGPFTIIKIINQQNVIIQKQNAQKGHVVHVNRLRHYKSQAESTESSHSPESNLSDNLPTPTPTPKPSNTSQNSQSDNTSQNSQSDKKVKVQVKAETSNDQDTAIPSTVTPKTDIPSNPKRTRSGKIYIISK